MNEKPIIVIDRPVSLQCAGKAIRMFLSELAASGGQFPHMDPMAEQEWWEALAHLELAHRTAERAGIHQAQAIAASPYR